MTKLDICFLGTTASIPTKYRNHSSIYLKYQSENEHSFLFDCGEGTQRQIFQSGLNFMRFDHIFITHWHADHFAGLLGLFETMSLEDRKKTLYIYGPEASKFVAKITDIGYSSKKFQIKPIDVDHKKDSVLLEEDEYKIISFPVEHGIPAVGYAFIEKDRIKIDKKKANEFGLPEKGKVFKELKDKKQIEYKGKKIKLENVALVEKGKRVFYSGDTKPSKYLIDVAKDCDVLIHDCTYFDNEYVDRKHTTLKDVLGIMEKTKCKKLVLTHISRRYQSIKQLNDLVSEEVKNHNVNKKDIIIAKDLMNIEV